MAAARTDKNKPPRLSLWPSTKQPVAANDTLQQFASGSMASDGSAYDPVGTQPLVKERLKARFRRSGSKLLSLLGIRGSWNVGKEPPTETGSPLDVNTFMNVDGPSRYVGASDAEHMGRAPANDTRGGHRDSTLRQVGTGHVRTESSRVSFAPPLPIPERLGSLNPARRRMKGSSNYQTDMELPETVETYESPLSTPSSVRRSKSSPGFVHRLTKKISSTFGMSTVIHRAHLKSRPSVQIVRYHAEALNALGNQGDSANDSSDPSTPLSGSGSPRSGATSTPPTSGEPSPNRSKSLFENELVEGKFLDGGRLLCPIREAPKVSATIATAEVTANTKIYFETKFDDMLGPYPRDLRSEEFLARMRSLPLTVDEQEEARQKWYQQETDYLRQCRVVNSNANAFETDDMVARAGYEPIEVLGRGSFGVVRLVRERQDYIWGPEDYSFRDHDDFLSFSMRRKVMDGETKDVYAMKVIRKSEMIRNSQEGHIRAERDLLVRSENSQWIVPLISSFQDSSNLYLIMDYMVGGDFLGLLIRKNMLPESVTKFYMAEMLNCLEETHRLCWIHRDVKPDNFLISPSGHLKISDFGLAFNGHWAHDQAYYNSHRYDLVRLLDIKVAGDAIDQKEARERREEPELRYDFHARYVPGKSREYPAFEYKVTRRHFARSVVGTSQYMAPEVIKGDYYDGRCDWWSFGIILFECLFGYTPFACEDRHRTKIKILHHLETLHFPRDKHSDRLVSTEAIDLISQLLQEREYRICSKQYKAVDKWLARQNHLDPLSKQEHIEKAAKPYYVYDNDAVDIKQHPFFAGVDFATIHETQPPFVPKVKGWGDIRYFDDCGEYDVLAREGISTKETDISQYVDGAPLGSQSKNENVHEEPGDYSSALRPPEKRLTYDEQKKQRARDRILRDKKIGKTALDIRKEGAFLGYSYLRPKPVDSAFELERGRPLLPKRAPNALSELWD